MPENTAHLSRIGLPITRALPDRSAPVLDRVLVALFVTAGVVALPLGIAWLVARWLP